MKQEPFIIERTYKAPVEKVWEAITDKDQTKQWYFDMPAFKPEVGTEFSFSGTGTDGTEYIHLCKVTEVIPNKKLSHTWTYKDQQGASLLTWELFEEGENTRVKLTHEGLESFPQDKKRFRQGQLHCRLESYCWQIAERIFGGKIIKHSTFLSSHYL